MASKTMQHRMQFWMSRATVSAKLASQVDPQAYGQDLLPFVGRDFLAEAVLVGSQPGVFIEGGTTTAPLLVSFPA